MMGVAIIDIIRDYKRVIFNCICYSFKGERDLKLKYIMLHDQHHLLQSILLALITFGYSHITFLFSVAVNFILQENLSQEINPSRPNPGRSEKINLNFCFHSSFGVSKGFMKALKDGNLFSYKFLKCTVREEFKMPSMNSVEPYF